MAKKPTHKKSEHRDTALEKKVGVDGKPSGKALREGEARYRAVVEDQTELICRWLPGGTLTFVNEAYCRYFGKTSEELIGYSFMPLIPEEDHEKVTRHFAALGRDNPLSTHEHRVITPSGEIRWQQWSNRAIFDGPDRLIEFQSLGRDITERKRMEEALRQSEKKYRSILESIEEGYYEVDLAGNLTFFNDSMCRILGYSKGELLGMNNRQYMDQENAKKVYEIFNRVYISGKPDKGTDWKITGKDGLKRDIETSVSLIKDNEGPPSGFRGVARDITDRRKAEEALRKSEYKYRLLAENMSDIIWSLDLKGRLTYISPSVKNSLGFTPEEAMELTLDGIFTPASRELVTKNMREVIKKEKQGKSRGSSKKLELEYIRKDGSTLWAELVGAALRDEDGNMIGFTGVTRDISERKQAEEALKIREKELEIKSRTLEETNAALKLILKKREEDKSELEETVLSNIRELVMPYIEKMKTKKMDRDQRTFISVIESNLNDIISAFLPRQPGKYLALTPTEIQISNLIKQGKHSKNIAVLMNLSKRTIDVHRDNIRRKLGIKGTATNLRSYLLSLR